MNKPMIFDTEPIDAHAWVELENGTIIDPYFEHYSMVKMIRNLKGEPQYSKFSNDDMVLQKCKDITKEGVRQYIKFSLAKNSNNPFWNDWEDRKNHCFINAYVNQKKYGGKIVYGKMGWEDSKGDIFWEYG